MRGAVVSASAGRSLSSRSCLHPLTLVAMASLLSCSYSTTFVRPGPRAPTGGACDDVDPAGTA